MQPVYLLIQLTSYLGPAVSHQKEGHSSRVVKKRVVESFCGFAFQESDFDSAKS